MAYLDFSTGELGPLALQKQVSEVLRRGLSGLERGAVMLAKTDGKDSLRDLTRYQRFSAIMFGLPRPNKLADPRLESLRRYAVAVAHDTEKSAAHEREQLVMLGYSDHQISAAEAIASRFRVKPVQGFWAIIAGAIIIGGAFWGINQYLEDWLIALVVAMAIALPIMAIAGPGARNIYQ